MYLNVSLNTPNGGESAARTPKTPEILNSLISLTSPPLHSYRHYQQRSTAALLSPDCSTPGDECGGGGWGGVGEEMGEGVESANSNNNPSQQQQQLYQQPHTNQHHSPFSSLLTPTSDGSPPPLLPPHSSTHHHPSYGPPYHHVEELSSPISTVEATRSALIKEGLKLTITSKLQQTTPAGDASPTSEDFLLPSDVVIKSELTHEDEERRRRRRERNKVAATKCRNKKKEMTEILVSESETVEEVNARLKGEVQRLRDEMKRLSSYLTDTKHRTSCKRKHKRADLDISSTTNVPELMLTSPSSSPSHVLLPITSPSSYCSSSSPCSFTSLMSPSDSKDFVNNLSFSPVHNSTSSTVDIAINSDSFGSINVASTAGSLDYIEPTIPLDTASTTCSKMTTSDYKVPSALASSSSRYHPYSHSSLPSHYQRSTVRQETVHDHSTTDSCASGANSQYPEISSDIGDYKTDCTSKASSMNYSCSTTVDLKTNPFKYPIVNVNKSITINPSSSEEPELTPLEVVKPSSSSSLLGNFRSEYRLGNKVASRPSLMASSCSARYSPYNVTCPDEVTVKVTEPTVITTNNEIVTAAGCGGQYSNNLSLHNPFFPPSTYSNL